MIAPSERDHTIRNTGNCQSNWPGLVLAFIAGAGLVAGYNHYRPVQKVGELLVQAAHITVITGPSAGEGVIASRQAPAVEAAPSVLPTSVDARGEPPTLPNASPPVPASAGPVEGEKAPEVKAEMSQPTPVVKPKLEPWQEEIILRNKGIRQSKRAPKELDLRDFEGIDPGRFRDWTADQWYEWTLTVSVEEQAAVPEVIRRALDEQDAARQAAVFCKWCTSDSPHADCRKLTRNDVQRYCELAPDYRGRNYKPLQHLPAVNPLAR